MAQPYVGEIRMFGGNFAPAGWMFCDGQLIPISENETLFNLIGTTYGGDGRQTFALPDLRGRTANHTGQGLVLGQKAGEEAHTVILSEMPAHNHIITASKTAGDFNNPAGHLLGASASPVYKAPATMLATAAENISSVGGSQPHENRQPFLTLNFVIALQGVFPSRN